MQAWAQPFAEWVTTDGSMRTIAFDYAVNHKAIMTECLSMNYLDLWIANLLRRNSVRLTQAITVVGHREKHFGPRSEYARVEMTIAPAEEFDVVHNVPCRKEFAALRVEWPCALFPGCWTLSCSSTSGRCTKLGSLWTMPRITKLTARRTGFARRGAMLDETLLKYPGRTD